MSVSGSLALLFLGAAVVENLVKLVVTFTEEGTNWKYRTSIIFGIVFSVLVAVNWDLDIFKLVGFGEGAIPYVGAVLTGLLISRGSNAIHNILTFLN